MLFKDVEHFVVVVLTIMFLLGGLAILDLVRAQAQDPLYPAISTTGEVVGYFPGESRRDFLARQAMLVILPAFGRERNKTDIIAEYSYLMADSMIGAASK